MSGELLRVLRTLKGWGQTELAKRAGVSQPTVCRAEKGRRVTNEQWAKLADALHCTVTYLLDPANLEQLRKGMKPPPPDGA